MDYDFHRIDYMLCGITYPRTLKILPSSGQKLEQKFAIGDKNGVLQCLSIKDEEPVVQFKTLPGKSITSVQLASTSGNHADKIFAASGNEVKGYTRKGKVFLTIETSVSETITSMCVFGSDLILCSGRTVTFYRDLREINSYICEDRVLDIAAFAAPNNTKVRLLVLIANKGAAMLENGQLVSRISIPAGPSRLAVPPSTHTPEIYTFYGASDGSIGLISYEHFGEGNRGIRDVDLVKFVWRNRQAACSYEEKITVSTLYSKCLVEGRSLGSVMCLGWYFSNGSAHLAVGRHDGSVQLYLIDLENLVEKPRLKYTYFCGEPITSIDGGCVGTEESEVLVATFSGRIFALRSGHLSGAVALSKVPQETLAARRAKLEAEIARLEKQTANEREKYQRSTRSVNSGLSTPPLLELQYEVLGATKDGWQETRLISAVPLDMLFIYCKKKLDMLTDSAAVLSVCSSQGKASDLLATVRCQAGTRRLWVRMRNVLASSSRPESVLVYIYALPAGAPRVARLITIRLPALPSYSQHEDPDCEKQSRPWCQLRVSGGFSVAEITSWLNEALPGDMPRPAATVNFARSHTLLGTLLVCNYQRGLVIFKSDNVSTIADMRRVVSDCSVEKGIRSEISCDVPDDCCIKSFELLEHLFKSEYKNKKDIALRKAIAALDLDANTMSSDGPLLCDDYMRTWESSDLDGMETCFDELVETVIKWNIDWHALSLHGDNFNNENENLRAALNDCNLKEVTKILSNKLLTPLPNEF